MLTTTTDWEVKRQEQSVWLVTSEHWHYMAQPAVREAQCHGREGGAPLSPPSRHRLRGQR